MSRRPGASTSPSPRFATRRLPRCDPRRGRPTSDRPAGSGSCETLPDAPADALSLPPARVARVPGRPQELSRPAHHAGATSRAGADSLEAFDDMIAARERAAAETRAAQGRRCWRRSTSSRSSSARRARQRARQRIERDVTSNALARRGRVAPVAGAGPHRRALQVLPAGRAARRPRRAGAAAARHGARGNSTATTRQRVTDRSSASLRNRRMRARAGTRQRVELVKAAGDAGAAEQRGFAARVAELAQRIDAIRPGRRRGRRGAGDACLPDSPSRSCSRTEAPARSYAIAGAVRAGGAVRHAAAPVAADEARAAGGRAAARWRSRCRGLAALAAAQEAQSRRRLQSSPSAARPSRSRRSAVAADAAQAARSYEAFLQIEGADPALRAQALRRLGDLRLDAGGQARRGRAAVDDCRGGGPR